MTILSFDTCFDACSVALRNGRTGAVVSERVLMQRGHAEALMPMIAHTMQSAGIAFPDLDRIAVTSGPGTFTGSRVGIAAALGFSLAHALPVVTGSSLECIARGILAELGHQADGYDGIAVVRDARRGSVYLEVTDTRGQSLGPPQLLDLDSARQLLRGGRVLAVGSGAALLAATDATHIAIYPASQLPEGIGEPDARHLLVDAATRTPTARPAPLYLRAPDATPSGTFPLTRLSPDTNGAHGARGGSTP